MNKEADEVLKYLKKATELVRDEVQGVSDPNAILAATIEVAKMIQIEKGITLNCYTKEDTSA